LSLLSGSMATARPTWPSWRRAAAERFNTPQALAITFVRGPVSIQRSAVSLSHTVILHHAGPLGGHHKRNQLCSPVALAEVCVGPGLRTWVMDSNGGPKVLTAVWCVPGNFLRVTSRLPSRVRLRVIRSRVSANEREGGGTSDPFAGLRHAQSSSSQFAL
jgi:hypothetical protein